MARHPHRPGDLEDPPGGTEPESAEVPYFDVGPDEPDSGDSTVARAREAHAGALLTIDGVEDVSIDRDDTGEDVIVVLARDHGVQDRVPQVLDGVRVRVEVSGAMDPPAPPTAPPGMKP